ncbi:MAG: hypothetical protein DGJ47_000676 [Rickettsiaceae bacterium]
MVNKLYSNLGPYKISEIAEYISAEIVGNADISISDIKSLEQASHQDISFLENQKYLPSFAKSKAAACIISNNQELKDGNQNMVLLKVDDAYFAYTKLLNFFYKPLKQPGSKIEKSSHIAPSAKIGNNCYIGHNVVIEDEVEIGDDAVIQAGAYIDYGVKIGSRARIDANVVISHSIIGDDVVILPGATIGQDGFGFATHNGVHTKILHIGRVIIGDNVEIGANSSIDRGSMNDTVIEDLCRIDNLVQIGHNAHIKTGSIIVAQVGIAGSSVIGKYCALGGQVGVAGHVNITDHVHLAGQSGVMQNITEPGARGGSPAIPIRDWHRQSIMLKKLIKNK